MAMGRVLGEAQGDFWVATADLPRSPGHPFYERLNQILDQGGFDAFCITNRPFPFVSGRFSCCFHEFGRIGGARGEQGGNDSLTLGA